MPVTRSQTRPQTRSQKAAKENSVRNTPKKKSRITRVTKKQETKTSSTPTKPTKPKNAKESPPKRGKKRVLSEIEPNEATIPAPGPPPLIPLTPAETAAQSPDKTSSNKSASKRKNKKSKKKKKYRPLRMNCTHCNRFFSTTNDLYFHIRENHDFKQCPHCPKKLSCMATFVYHVRTHTKEKPYYCPIPGCDFRNGVKYNLKVHLASLRHGGPDNLKEWADVLDLDVCSESMQKRREDSRVHELSDLRPKKKRRRREQPQPQPYRGDYAQFANVMMSLNQGSVVPVLTPRDASGVPTHHWVQSILPPAVVMTSTTGSSSGSVLVSQIPSSGTSENTSEVVLSQIDSKGNQRQNTGGQKSQPVPFHLQPDSGTNAAMPMFQGMEEMPPNLPYMNMAQLNVPQDGANSQVFTFPNSMFMPIGPQVYFGQPNPDPQNMTGNAQLFESIPLAEGENAVANMEQPPEM